jgi:hypothetical protein
VPIQKFDRPNLVIHGDDGQIVPIDLSAHVVRRMPVPESYGGESCGPDFTRPAQTATGTAWTRWR